MSQPPPGPPPAHPESDLLVFAEAGVPLTPDPYHMIEKKLVLTLLERPASRYLPSVVERRKVRP